MTRRYSDFDHIRSAILDRWPGCYIPPLPKKKMIGNNDQLFIEDRQFGLNVYVKEMAFLHHLWYSEEFQLLVRGSGDIEKVFYCL